MATLDKFMSDVVIGGVQSGDLGYSYEEASVTFSTDMEAGAVLIETDDVYSWCATDDVASAVGVLVDAKSFTSHPDYEDLVDATDYTMVVAVRGITVNYNELTLSDSTDTDNIDSAVDALKAYGIKATDKVVG